MKQHLDHRSGDWKSRADDVDLLTAAGVPGVVAKKAVALGRRPLPSAAQRWLDHLDFVHKPNLDAVREQPDLGGMGLVLYGESGKGKTIMAIQILLDILRSDRLHWVDDSHRSRLMFSILGRFFDWQDLSDLLRRSNSNSPPPEWDSMRACLYGAPIDGTDPYHGPFYGGGIVVVDDISRERHTEYNTDRLHAILRKRNSEALITVLTTNVAPQDWAAAYDNDVLAAFMRRSFIAAEVS